MSSEKTEYLFDTWAWVEYFSGSSQGAIVYDLLISHQIHTSIISIAELSDKYNREGLKTEWEERYKFLLLKSNILPISLDIAKISGDRKLKLRQLEKNIGLADAIIIETAIQNDLVVVTGDPHFKSLDNVLILE